MEWLEQEVISGDCSGQSGWWEVCLVVESLVVKWLVGEKVSEGLVGVGAILEGVYGLDR